MGTIALTGATGLLGASLVPRLLAAGHELRILVRPRPGERRVAKKGITFVEGYLDEVAPIDELVRGVDCIVHAAYAKPEDARQGLGSTTEQWLQANFMGTMRLLERAVDTPGRQLIYTSSLAVFSSSPDHDPLGERFVRDETFPLWPREFYGSLRAACEKLLITSSVTYGLNTSVWRLGCVFGLRTPLHESPLYPVVDEAVRTGEVRTRTGTYAIAVDDAAAILAGAVGDASVKGQVTNVFDRWIDHATVAPEIAKCLERPVRNLAEPVPEPRSPIRGDTLRARFQNFTTDEAIRTLVAQLVERCRERV
ncbi:MAG: NAD(P)-dependent oxidoreductase [Planctomycetota bacterium]